MTNYVLACCAPWGRDAFSRRRAKLAGDWTMISAQAELDPKMLDKLQPRYLFFPHWSWIVPDAIISRHECVCFHMTDLPYGRGGSPLQNLIVRDFGSTKLTALRMTGEIDAGPIYAKRALSLEGAAHEIYARAAEVSLDLVEWIVAEEPRPVPQVGEPTTFARRRPAESLLPHAGSAERLYDHIRMLDAKGYPAAFIEHGEWRIEFDGASLNGDAVKAKVRIFKKSQA